MMSTIESEASGRSRVEEDAGERERERGEIHVGADLVFVY